MTPNTSELEQQYATAAETWINGQSEIDQAFQALCAQYAAIAAAGNTANALATQLAVRGVPVVAMDGWRRDLPAYLERNSKARKLWLSGGCAGT